MAHDSGHGKMYFFTRHKKFKNGPKIDRQAAGGFWRKTGGDIPVESKDGKAIVTKTSLTYYRKDPTEEKTKWLMKEYKITESQPSKNQNDDHESEVVGYIVCIFN